MLEPSLQKKNTRGNMERSLTAELHYYYNLIKLLNLKKKFISKNKLQANKSSCFLKIALKVE